MKCAIVESYSRAPRYGEFTDPVAQAGEQLVAVRAAALTPLTKSIAAGKHYSSGNAFPFVPGVDGCLLYTSSMWPHLVRRRYSSQHS